MLYYTRESDSWACTLASWATALPLAALRIADLAGEEAPRESEDGNRGAMLAADAMHRVRMECSLWVPQDVSAKLFKFEKKIRVIGINAAYTQDAVGVPAWSERHC